MIWLVGSIVMLNALLLWQIGSDARGTRLAIYMQTNRIVVQLEQINERLGYIDAELRNVISTFDTGQREGDDFDRF